jgi:hypothetical protein
VKAAQYAKAIAAAIGLGVTLAVDVWGTGNHWVELAVAVASVLGVYGVPNQGKPPAA